MRANARRREERESGQMIILFALMAVAMVGFLALALDLGFMFAQRRFDQNGADAAALAAGRLMSVSVSARDQAATQLYFLSTDPQVYSVARQYAGLDPASTSSDPTGTNQNPALNNRNKLVATLEYSNDGGATWCYSPSEPGPHPAGVPACGTNLDANGNQLPPDPNPDRPYKVRVTVSSTTELFIWPAFSQLMGGGTGDITPSECLRATGASGVTSCAQAVVVINGSPTQIVKAPIIPAATLLCQIPPLPGEPIPLWSSNPIGSCTSNVNLGQWKALLDLTAEDKWCSNPNGGDGSDPDYRYWALLPRYAYSGTLPNLTTILVNYRRQECKNSARDDTTVPALGWHRASFRPDPSYQGTCIATVDTAYWSANGFSGRLGDDKGQVPDENGKIFGEDGYYGNWYPTYVDAKTDQAGNMGQNIATGFYCDTNQNHVTETTCSVNPVNTFVSNPPPPTYFFAKNQDGYYDECPDALGQKVKDQGDRPPGCRDAMVPVWDTREQVQGNLNQSGGTGWKTLTGTGATDRVRIVRLYPMRIYCDHDNSGLCTQSPKSVAPSAGNSEVWGYLASPIPPQNCPNCSYTGGPTIWGNKVTLEQ